MGIDTVQWRAAIGTFTSSQKDIGELEKDNHLTSAGIQKAGHLIGKMILNWIISLLQ